MGGDGEKGVPPRELLSGEFLDVPALVPSQA
jgi:hypothetical protein